MRTRIALIAHLLSEPRYQQLSLRAAFLLYGAILVLGSLPGARADIGELASGFVLHATAYAVITLLLFGGVAGSGWNRACKSVLTVVAMGALDECVQSFFPYRTASIGDWLVDIHAALFSAAMLWAIWPKSQAGKRSEPAS